MIPARCSRSCGQAFGKAVIGNLITLDAERGLNDPGGVVSVVAFNCLFEKRWSCVYSSLMTGLQTEIRREPLRFRAARACTSLHRASSATRTHRSRGFADRRARCDTQRLAIQTSFAEKVTSFQNTYDRFGWSVLQAAEQVWQLCNVAATRLSSS